jgi:hypothetical protein
LLLKYPVALHRVSLVVNTLLQYRKRAPIVRVPIPFLPFAA